MVRDPAADLTPGDRDQLAYAVAHPRRIDPAALDALAALLAAQRRLEDAIGAAAVVGPVAAQLDVVTALAGDARGQLRPRLVSLAAQWAQYAGWLHTATQDPRGAERLWSRSLEWATEAGDRDLIGTVMSFRGYAAEARGEIGAMIGLSRVTIGDPAVFVGQRAYDRYQLARGLAYTGDAGAALDALAAGDDEARAAAEYTGVIPPWHYYRSPSFFSIEAGKGFRVLAAIDKRYARRAVALLSAGLAGLPPDARAADWGGSYLVELATALVLAGDLVEAEAALTEARQIAAATRSGRLVARVNSAVRSLSATA